MARKQLIRVLPSDWPARITQAGNGLEGLQAIREGKGEVVFLDLTMPEMDGYELLAILGEENLLADRTIIVVSADVQEAAAERVRALGAAAFVRKPIESGTLQRCLADLNLLPSN